MPIAIKGLNGNSDVKITNSALLGLALYDKSSREISGFLKGDSHEYYEFWIKRNILDIDTPQFIKYNFTVANNKTMATLGYMINNKNVSIHFHFTPDDLNNSFYGYVALLKYGKNPTQNDYDLMDIYCQDGRSLILLNIFLIHF